MTKIDPLFSALGILGDEVDVDVETETPDALTKFLQNAELAGALGHPHAATLAVESAPRSRAVADHYAKLAKDAAATNPAPPASRTLEKRAGETILRVEETHYPRSGRVVCAEIGMDGSVVRVYEKQA